ncbi:MAG: hypothetical protein JSW00_09330 [Thermoplasmata archaeon]|nr:MAG: hypothetical protein JSW00_09330 [Thermoplasmata archaeon]
MSAMLIGISFEMPNTSAGTANHDVGELQIIFLSDFGRILRPLQWPNPGTSHTVSNQGTGFLGLVVDQANYDHTPGSVDIADCYKFGSNNYWNQDDFTPISLINMTIDDGTTQKSIASFQNTGTTQDPNDILINQTCWTVKDKDWAILQWDVINIKSPAADITDFCLGLEIDISQSDWGVDPSYGLGGDSGDDIDGFDVTENVYWASDDGGTTLGFGSVFAWDPITHYFSKDYHPGDYNEYKTYWENETWLYNRIRAPNSVEGASPGNRTSTVGWNGNTIPAGTSRTFTLVIALNSTKSSMITAIKDARYYYHNNITGFLITEFSDSAGSHQIEVYNNGREATPASNLEFSVDGGSTFLTGVWDKDPIPTYEHAVITVTGGGTIHAEGDTISLYENSELVDLVAFGQEGVAPDPLPGESTERHYNSSSSSYTDDWLHQAPTGDTFGAYNNVGIVIRSPEVVLNRVMFNPSVPSEGYVELMFLGLGSLNISDYEIICNDRFTIPTGIVLSNTNRFYVFTYSDMPTFFTNMNSAGDNAYLYDRNDNLLDMVGWNSSHTQGYFMSRSPDGTGTYQGFNDKTSEAAGWVFDQQPVVLLTEFYMDSSSAQIEIYNPRGGEKLLDARWSLESSVNGPGALPGTWALGTIPANGGYDYFTMSPGPTPGDEGDTITLYYDPGSGQIIMDQVAFGTHGKAPDPLAAESTSRYWNSTSLSCHDEWTREDTPTFGAQNDVPPIDYNSKLILNEILFNPINPDDFFVELYLISGTLDISVYRIVCDSEFVIPSGTILSSSNPFFYLIYSMDSPFFDNMDSSGDNVYLYDPNGRLLDMAGWSSQHEQGKSMRRIPDGNGTRDGFDDPSSIAAGWVFDCIPTSLTLPPGPPRDLQANLVTDAKDVFISWNASLDDGQGENDVEGYTVYKSNTGVNGTYEFAAWISATGSASYNWTDKDAGDGDWNDYFYIVRANDTSDSEEQNTDKVGKFVNYLVKNWNLISVPLIQVNTSMEYVLQTIEGNYITIQGYHAGKSRPWLHWHKNKPKYFNDDIEINHKEGYYIRMTNPDYLIVAGRVPSETQIPLKTGWNLIGYPCLINQTRDDALSSIDGKYNMVEYYDPIKGKEVRLDPGDYMKPGLGYWIHATEDCVLII